MTMTRTRLAALAAALTLALGGARMAPAADCGELKHLTWLLGHWRAAAGERVIREYWAPVSTETWEGFSETRAAAPGGGGVTAGSGEGAGGGDAAGVVIESESLRLVELAGEVFYLAKVGHNPLPIAFRLTECGEGLAVFENPAHDFPRRLEYRLVGSALIVRVSDGAEGGQGFTLEFARN